MVRNNKKTASQPKSKAKTQTIPEPVNTKAKKQLGNKKTVEAKVSNDAPIVKSVKKKKSQTVSNDIPVSKANPKKETKLNKKNEVKESSSKNLKKDTTVGKKSKKVQPIEEDVSDFEMSDFEDDDLNDLDAEEAMLQAMIAEEGGEYMFDYFGEFDDEDEDGFADYDMMDNDSGSDDDDNGALIQDENDDLEELLSLEAEPNKKTKKSKNRKMEEDEEEFDELNVNFEFFDPDGDRDYHAIKGFVSKLIDSKDFDCSNLADIISSQAVVGTVIKADDAGNEPLGFITCLDYEEHKDAPSMKQIKNFVLSNAGTEKNKKKMDALFNDKLGLIIQDRLMNLPMEVVPVLYNELTKDLDYARGLMKGQWDFKNYLVISKCCEVTAKTGPVQDVWYMKFEDEFFQREASIVRKFPSKTAVPWTGVGKLPAHFNVMIVPSQGLNNVLKTLIQIIGINGEEF